MEPSKSSSSSNVLFDKSKNTEEQEDIWDDRALIRAYERSMRRVNKKLSGATKTPTTATEAAVARAEAYREPTGE